MLLRYDVAAREGLAHAVTVAERSLMGMRRTHEHAGGGNRAGSDSH
jgi:hypothetical protein